MLNRCIQYYFTYQLFLPVIYSQHTTQHDNIKLHNIFLFFSFHSSHFQLIFIWMTLVWVNEWIFMKIMIIIKSHCFAPINIIVTQCVHKCICAWLLLRLLCNSSLQSLAFGSSCHTTIMFVQEKKLFLAPCQTTLFSLRSLSFWVEV